MADVKLKWNIGTFTSIANEVNEAICIPAATRVRDAARVGLADHHPELDAIHLQTDPRSGVRDWAHVRVINGHPHADLIEAKHGVLGRAMGAA